VAGGQCFKSDIFEPSKLHTLEEELEARRSELRNGLTGMQRLFLFGKLRGLNDKDAALAAGYSVSVAKNTKQRIWKPRVRSEFERLQRTVSEQAEITRLQNESESKREYWRVKPQ